MLKSKQRFIAFLLSIMVAVSGMSLGFSTFAAEPIGNNQISANIKTVDDNSNISIYSNQTEITANNYSIPASLYAKDSSFSINYDAYRGGTPIPSVSPDFSTDYDTTSMWDDNAFPAFVGGVACFSYKSGSNVMLYNETWADLFYDFKDIYAINEITYGAHTTPALRAKDFAVYASNDFVTLFDDSNKIKHFNKPHAYVSLKFDNPLEARYVAIRFFDTCSDHFTYAENDYLRLGEFNVFGKFSKVGQSAEVVATKTYNDSLLSGCISIAKNKPYARFIKNGTLVNTRENLPKLTNFTISDSDEFSESNWIFKDDNEKHIFNSNTYIEVVQDLGSTKEISKLVLAFKESDQYTVGAFEVYVSDSPEYNGSNKVADVSNITNPQYAFFVNMASETKGRYVTLRIYRPARGHECATGAYPKLINNYIRMSEFVVCGSAKYTYSGGKLTYQKDKAYKKTYFENVLGFEKLNNSLIANNPVYEVENISGFNFGQHSDNTSIYKGVVNNNDQEFYSKSTNFTLTEYHNADGDLMGQLYTNIQYDCGGINGHASTCANNSACSGEVISIADDGSKYQTLIYKLPALSRITEVDVFHAYQEALLTRRYQVSFANDKYDLFTENSTTIEVVKVELNHYDILTLETPIDANFFAIRILCGVQNGVVGAKSGFNSHYARVGHIALQGEYLVCADNVHSWQSVIDYEPTCGTVGYMHKYCTKCDFVSNNILIPPTNNHTIEIVGYKEPTTSKEGYTGDQVCKECKKTITKGELIPIKTVSFANSLSIDGEINCKNKNLKVYFTLPKDAENIRGMQFRVKFPSEFSIQQITSPLTDKEWSLTCNPANGIIILDCGLSLTTLEDVAVPDSLGRYHVATIKIADAVGTQSGQKNVNLVVEDVTSGYNSNENTKSVTLNFNYTAEHQVEVIPEIKATCTTDGYTAGSKCKLCDEVIIQPEFVSAFGHTNKEIPAIAATCEVGGFTSGVKCSVCDVIIEAPVATEAIGHNIIIDREASRKYCSNNCGIDFSIVFVSFYLKNIDTPVYETFVEEGGSLTDEDVEKANSVVSNIYGYDMVGWDCEVTTQAVFTCDTVVNAVYTRKTDKFNIGITYTDNSTEECSLQFDQKFTVTDANATAFLIDNQVVGGKGSVTLYACGKLDLVASKNVVAEDISVAIMKTVKEVVNGKNVLRIFTNVYNPNNKVVKESGVIILSGITYDLLSDKNFTFDNLGTNEYLVIKSNSNVNQLLVTYNGIANNVRRIVRAYAKIDDSTYYNSEAAIQDIKFDNGSSDVTFNDGIYQIVFPNDPLGNIK